MSLPPAIFVMGPTASGKTALALELADKLPVELISVDSALVYKGMDIGTAKPDAKTLEQYPHRLVDIKEPSQPYSAAEFQTDALAAMQEISDSGRIPLLVGGTMMYYKFLCEGAADLPPADETIREQILLEANELGWPEMHKKLQGIDVEAANKIKPNDSQRIQRALEVYKVSGQTLSEFQRNQPAYKLPYEILCLGIAPKERSLLHERIALRLEQMFAQGFIEEVEGLKQREDVHIELPAMRSVGYRQVWEYLDGHYSYEQMRDKALFATRQLAKRQLTWLRKWPNLHWLESTDKDILAKCLKILDSTARINVLS